MTKDDIFAICDSLAEAQAILHDHLECEKHSPAEALAKLQRVLSEDGLLQGPLRCRTFSGDNAARIAAQSPFADCFP